MYTKLSAGFLRLGLIMGLLLAALTTQTASAAIRVRYVKMGGVSSGECLTWATACELQYVLTGKAVAGDQVWVRQGIYRPGSGQPDTFALIDGVALYGGFAGTEVLLSQRNISVNVTVLSGDIGVSGMAGDNSYHVVFVGSTITSATVLDGFTIMDGNASDSISPAAGAGGGLFSSGGSPILRNLIFISNLALNGGAGMASISGNPTLTGVTFTGNMTSGGGGGFYIINGSPKLTRVTFQGNSAGTGGGLYSEGAAPALTSVVFSSNRADWGGGMYSFDGSPLLVGVSFRSNWANYGGGFYSDTASALTVLKNTTFTGNSATNGGGIYNVASSLQMTGGSLKNNSAVTRGGGIYSENSGTAVSSTFSKVVFSGNTAFNGAGMYNTGSFADNNTATFTNVTFSGNTAAEPAAGGGGMYNDNTVHFSRVSFNGNFASEFGGGLFNGSGGTATLNNVAFTANSSTQGAGEGGGIYNIGASITLANVTFSHNYGGMRGGGMENISATSVSLKNVTFDRNSTQSYGGWMYNFDSSPQFNNVTVSGNIESSTGGGMYNDGDSHPVIRNTILWGNGNYEFRTYGTSSVSLSYSVLKGACPSGVTCTNVLHTNPLLAPLANNGGFTKTMALQLGSSAIDKGNLCEPKDQRGVLRPQGPRCDIGVYEFVP